MAAVRGGSGGIEDELVGAAVQISELRQEKKRLTLARDSALVEIEEFKKIRVENSRQIQEHEARRAEVAATHAKELEDVKRNEREAIETAKKACAELQKRNEETTKLKTELSEAKAAAAETAAGPPVNRRRVTATGLKPVSPGPVAAAAGGAGAPLRRGVRYAMDEGEEKDGNGGAVDETEDGVGGSGGEEEEEEEEDNDEDEDDDDDREDENKGTGFFGWLTGSAKKRRRGN